jgi:hypothetical protein
MQTAQAWWRLNKLGHEVVAIAANYGHEGTPINIDVHGEKTQVWPRGLAQSGNDILGAHATVSKADIVITLYDVWMFDPKVTVGFKWCLPEKAEVNLMDGTTRTIREIVDAQLPVVVAGWKDGEMVGSRIESYQKIPAKIAGEIIEITTGAGHRLEVTAENEIAVRDVSGELKWVSASCLIPGMMVYCTASIPTRRNKREQAELGTRCGVEIPADANQNGMGVSGGNDRCGRQCVDLEGDEAQSVHLAANNQRLHDQRELNVVAENKTRNASEQPRQAIESVAAWAEPCADIIHNIQHTSVGIQVLSDSGGDAAVYDYKESAGGISHLVHREADDIERDNIQRAICVRGSGDLVTSESFEPQSVRTVRSLGRPYETVYDIKTSTGNFIADGVLIHNCPWLPVDHDPCPPPITRALATA